jgi:hypothetical protein
MIGLAALLFMLSMTVAADAAGWGGCYPHCSAPCQYTYQTQYQPVQRTICEVVPVTTTVDVTECYLQPVTTKQKETYYETVQRPMKGKQTVYRCVTEKQKQTYHEVVHRPMKGKHTVYRCVPEKQEQTYYECVPVTRKVEYSYYECVPVTKTVKQTYTVHIPVVTKENRQAVYTVCEVVPVTQTRQVICYTPQAVATCAPSCSGGWCGAATSCVQYVPTVQNVSCTTYQTVAKQVVQNYTVDVCTYKTENRTQDVTYVENTMQLKKGTADVVSYEHQPRKQMVEVQVMRPVEEEYTYYVCDTVAKTQVVDVQVMKPVEEEYTYYVCDTVAKTQDVDVQVMKPFEEEYTYYVCDTVAKTRDVDVTTYVTKTRTVKQQVTSYQTVTRNVTQYVPVTVCVPVCGPSGHCGH